MRNLRVLVVFPKKGLWYFFKGVIFGVFVGLLKLFFFLDSPQVVCKGPNIQSIIYSVLQQSLKKHLKTGFVQTMFMAPFACKFTYSTYSNKIQQNLINFGHISQTQKTNIKKTFGHLVTNKPVLPIFWVRKPFVRCHWRKRRSFAAVAALCMLHHPRDSPQKTTTRPEQGSKVIMS